jgi:hypothetical protein
LLTVWDMPPQPQQQKYTVMPFRARTQQRRTRWNECCESNKHKKAHSSGKEKSVLCAFCFIQGRDKFLRAIRDK